MRIDSYSPSSPAAEVSNSSGMSKVDGQGSARSATAAGEDRATLTSDSAAVETLVTTAMRSPAVRQETVENLRLAVSSGQYQLDPAAIADAMVADQ